MGLFGFKTSSTTRVEQNIGSQINSELKALGKQEDEVSASIQLANSAKERVEEIAEYLGVTLKMDQELEKQFRRILNASLIAQRSSSPSEQQVHRLAAEEALKSVMKIDEEAEQMAEKEGVEYRYMRRLDDELAKDIRTLRGLLADLQRYARKTRERTKKISDLALEAINSLSPAASAESLAARKQRQAESARAAAAITRVDTSNRLR